MQKEKETNLLTKKQLVFVNKTLKDSSIKTYNEKLDIISGFLNKKIRTTRYIIEDKLGLYKRKQINRKNAFSNLTDEDICFIYETYWDKSKKWDDRMKILTEKYNLNERTLRKYCSEKLNITEKASFDSECEHLEQAKLKSFDSTKKYFIITSAQNATEVNEPFLENIEKYASFLNGEILIIPTRYNNPGSIISKNDKDQNWWDSKVVKYLSLQRHNLNNNVSVLSDVKVQPTAVRPLNGFESLAGNGSTILAHPRIHMKSLPTLDETPKLLFTSGICTKPNYTDTKTGKIGDFHHSYGFVIVEIENNETYFIRQVIAEKNGSFSDLYFNVKGGVVSRNESIAALVKGDIHYGNHNKDVIEQSFNTLIPKLNPKNIILHDVFDGYSINHHEEKDWVKNYQKSLTGKDLLKKEIQSLLDWLKSIKDLNLTIVFSNHDDFLNKFIINSNPQKLVNPQNALAYVEYAKIMLENESENGLLAHLISKEIPEIKCLGRNDSFIINGWELAVHGMDGINGSKGSIEQYKKLNTHIITAHAHSALRIDGAVQVGTNSELKMGYNNGMSSWVHSDAIIHNNKKVQHIFFLGKNKEFTMLK